MRRYDAYALVKCYFLVTEMQTLNTQSNSIPENFSLNYSILLSFKCNVVFHTCVSYILYRFIIVFICI